MTTAGLTLTAGRNGQRTTLAAFALQLVMFCASADLTSVELGGASLRLAWVLLPFAAVLIRRSGHDRHWLYLTLTLFALHVLAALASAATVKGLVYSFWILFSYIFFFRVGVDAARQLGKEAWQVVLLNGRLQILLALLLVLSGVHERAQFLYYEPSYMAIGLAPYVFAAIHVSRRRALDMLLIVALLASNQSANLLLVLVVALVQWVLSNGLNWRTVLVVLAVPGGAATLYFVALNNPDNANHNLAEWIYAHGLSWELIQAGLERGGNRVPRIEAAWEVAGANPWWGVGPGNYVAHTDNLDFSHISGGLWWLDPSGLPPVNVLLDAAVSAGFAATAIMVLAFVGLWRSASRVPDAAARHAIFGALAGIAVAMQLESNYLRAYVWLAFGLFAGMIPRRDAVDH